MINGLQVLAVITARGGSKGIPRKNIIEVAGKPLIGWTIQAAKESKYIDRLVLSSDDVEIMQVAQSLGCEVPFIRPADLATDQAPGVAPILHALDKLSGFDLVVLLQPTSPLRLAEDIDGSVEALVSAATSGSCVTVCEVPHSPYRSYKINPADHVMMPLFPEVSTVARRQDLPKTFIPNGAVYVSYVNKLREEKTFFTDNTIAYIMPSSRSVDVDSYDDLAYLQYAMRR